MDKTHNTDAPALADISSAIDLTEKNLIVTEILEENAMIERLSRAVMAALIGSSWVDEWLIANNYGTIRGAIKDTLMETVMRPDLQELAAIEQASRTWTRPTESPIAQ